MSSFPLLFPAWVLVREFSLQFRRRCQIAQPLLLIRAWSQIGFEGAAPLPDEVRTQLRYWSKSRSERCTCHLQRPHRWCTRTDCRAALGVFPPVRQCRFANVLCGSATAVAVRSSLSRFQALVFLSRGKAPVAAAWWTLQAQSRGHWRAWARSVTASVLQFLLRLSANPEKTRQRSNFHTVSGSCVYAR